MINFHDSDGYEPTSASKGQSLSIPNLFINSILDAFCLLISKLVFSNLVIEKNDFLDILSIF